MSLSKHLIFLIVLVFYTTLSDACRMESFGEEEKVLSTNLHQHQFNRLDESPRIIALVGAGGTGKTTVINELKKLRPNWIYLSELTRTLVPMLGYKSPWNIVDEVGIAFYESMTLSHWCVLDPNINPFLKKEKAVCILDRSPFDNLAYYYSTRKENEKQYESFLKSLTQCYSKYINLYLFFPTGVIPLVNDDMRAENADYQKQYEHTLLKLLEEYKSSIQTIKTTTIGERVAEIITIVEGSYNSEILN